MLEKMINKDLPRPLESKTPKQDLNRRIEVCSQGPNEGGFYSTREERIGKTPSHRPDRGAWSGERGNSIYRLNERGPKEIKANSILKSKGLEGISYKEGIPDFSKVADATVCIPNMTSNRPFNFEQADRALAAKWNIEAKNGKSDWTARIIKNYRKEGDETLSWHERSDCKTMDLVPYCVHDSFDHSGGVMECKIRESIGTNVKYRGVKFDD